MWQVLENYFRDNWLLAISTPIYTLLISLEVLLSNYQKRNYYSLPETLINFWLNILNTAIGISVKFLVLGVLTYFAGFAFLTIPDTFWYWLLLFIGVDLCFYFEHRSEHYCRVLWAVHVTHHSSVEFNLTTGFRSSVFRPFVSFWFFIPLVLLGFEPLDILLVDAICQIYGIMVHTRYIQRMPSWFEAVFVSPSHHRVHHASNIPYLDKNMGMVLIIWDRFFGTFQNELEAEPVVYGLTKNPAHPHHPVRIIFHEWKQLLHDIRKPGVRWTDRWKYLFYAPGWSHDGTTKTSSQLREELNQSK